jgi:hypothetical protein
LLGRRWLDASGSNVGAYARANVATNHGSDDGSNDRPDDGSDHRSYDGSDDEADNGSDDRSERPAHDGSDDCADDGSDHRSHDGTDDRTDDRANNGTDGRADDSPDHAPHGDADARSDGNSDPNRDSGVGDRRLADVRIRRSAGRLQSVHGCLHANLTFGAAPGLEYVDRRLHAAGRRDERRAQPLGCLDRRNGERLRIGVRRVYRLADLVEISRASKSRCLR